MVAKTSCITFITPSPVFKFDFPVVEHNNKPKSHNPGAGLFFPWLCPINKMILQLMAGIPAFAHHSKVLEHIFSFLLAQELFPQSLFHSRVGFLELGSASVNFV